jgi:ADP-heptose:LPS heptosyltransferase
LHPGAGARVKRWAAEGFRGVGDAWVEAGGEAVILLGPAEEDDAESWRSAGYEPLTGVGIAAVATLMTSASAWVGNDSGMSHLAGALGMRGVVIFGPTRPRRWRPLGGRLTAIEIDGRSVAAVTQEVLAILGTPGTPP